MQVRQVACSAWGADLADGRNGLKAGLGSMDLDEALSQNKRNNNDIRAPSFILSGAPSLK
jgi:hypothetical protein